MDNIKSLYLSFDGRIGRKSFWLGALGIIVAGLVLTFILSPILGANTFGAMDMMTTAENMTSEEMSSLMLDFSARSGWVSLVVYLILFVPISAVVLKRRHDRGSAGMEYWAYAALSILMILLQATGIGYSVVEIGGFSVPAPTMLTSVVMMGSGILGLYLLVVCGFLAGNDGENSYGPHPDS